MAMAVAVKRGMALLMTVITVAHAAVHKVGDSAGWTTMGNVDYKSWAATKTFQLGDVVVFEYNPQFHNVMHVTHSMFRNCNTSAPLATYTSGNDSINITTRGHHFFFCGVPGHCQSGQKVDINVLRLTSETAPTPSQPATAPVSDSEVPAAIVPAPSPSNAVALQASQVINVFAMSGLLFLGIVGLLG